MMNQMQKLEIVKEVMGKLNPNLCDKTLWISEICHAAEKYGQNTLEIAEAINDEIRFQKGLPDELPSTAKRPQSRWDELWTDFAMNYHGHFNWYADDKSSFVDQQESKLAYSKIKRMEESIRQHNFHNRREEDEE
jgi:hypothetical protein